MANWIIHNSATKWVRNRFHFILNKTAFILLVFTLAVSLMTTLAVAVGRGDAEVKNTLAVFSVSQGRPLYWPHS